MYEWIRPIQEVLGLDLCVAIVPPIWADFPPLSQVELKYTEHQKKLITLSFLTKIHCFKISHLWIQALILRIKHLEKRKGWLYKRLENAVKSQSVIYQNSLHTSLWLQWLLCMTVALNWLITLHILLIWHHLTYFLFPNKQYWTDDQV